MAKYISLIRFTEKGASAIKDSAKRAKAFDEVTVTILQPSICRRTYVA